MIVQQKRCWNLNICLRTLFYFIFNWSVYPLISSTKSALQESRGCSRYQHTAFRVFSTDWQLVPTGLRSDLVFTDAGWHRLNLLTDTRRTSPGRKHKHRLKLTQTAATQHTRSTLPTNSTLLAAPVSTMARQLHRQQSSHDDTICRRNDIYEISRNCPIRIALTFRCRHWRFYCRKLKDIHECTSRSNMPKDGRERYVLFFKITSEIKT